MKWIEALKVWNKRTGGAWCVPRKGTSEHAEVIKIMRGDKEEAAKKAAAEEAEEAAVVKAITKKKPILKAKEAPPPPPPPPAKKKPILKGRDEAIEKLKKQIVRYEEKRTTEATKELREFAYHLGLLLQKELIIKYGIAFRKGKFVPAEESDRRFASDLAEQMEKDKKAQSKKQVKKNEASSADHETKIAALHKKLKELQGVRLEGETKTGRQHHLDKVKDEEKELIATIKKHYNLGRESTVSTEVAHKIMKDYVWDDSESLERLLRAKTVRVGDKQIPITNWHINTTGAKIGFMPQELWDHTQKK